MSLCNVQVVEWLASYRSSLSSQEWEALALHVDDIVLIKIRYVHLDIGKGEAVLMMLVLSWWCKHRQSQHCAGLQSRIDMGYIRNHWEWIVNLAVHTGNPNIVQAFKVE